MCECRRDLVGGNTQRKTKASALACKKASSLARRSSKLTLWNTVAMRCLAGKSGIAVDGDSARSCQHARQHGHTDALRVRVRTGPNRTPAEAHLFPEAPEL